MGVVVLLEAWLAQLEVLLWPCLQQHHHAHGYGLKHPEEECMWIFLTPNTNDKASFSNWA